MKSKNLPKHLSHFLEEKVWYRSKKIFAFIACLSSFHFLCALDNNWKSIAVKALFLILMFLIFAIAKSMKDVIAIAKQIDAIVDYHKK